MIAICPPGCFWNHSPTTSRRSPVTKCYRYAHLDTLRNATPLDVAAVKEALHAVNQGEMTVHSMVFEPTARRLHLAMGRGPITGGPFTAIDLTEYFRRD